METLAMVQTIASPLPGCRRGTMAGLASAQRLPLNVSELHRETEQQLAATLQVASSPHTAGASEDP